jgi:predicted  nucleic acid-binding Zn-ribbon protein
MVEKKEKEEVRVADFTEVFKGLGGFIKESYLSNLNIALSLWEENRKFANARIDQFLATQKEYAEQLKAASERFLPKEAVSFWNGNYKTFDVNFERLAEVQRDYINLVRSVSEKFAKETVSLTQKTTEKAFSAFEEYLRFIGV